MTASLRMACRACAHAYEGNRSAVAHFCESGTVLVATASVAEVLQVPEGVTLRSYLARLVGVESTP